MGVLSWIVVGIAGGWLACRLAGRRTTMDYVLNIVVGILGACIGGFITNLVIFRPVFELNLQSFVVSQLATIVFLALTASLRR